MDSSLVGGLILAIAMIALMLAPNYFFQVKNYEETRDKAIRDLIKNYEDSEKDKTL